MMHSRSQDTCARDEISLSDKDLRTTVDISPERRPYNLLVFQDVGGESGILELIIACWGIELVEFKLVRPQPVDIYCIVSDLDLPWTPARCIRRLRIYFATQPGHLNECLV